MRLATLCTNVYLTYIYKSTEIKKFVDYIQIFNSKEAIYESMTGILVDKLIEINRFLNSVSHQ